MIRSDRPIDIHSHPEKNDSRQKWQFLKKEEEKNNLLRVHRPP